MLPHDIHERGCSFFSLHKISWSIIIGNRRTGNFGGFRSEISGYNIIEIQLNDKDIISDVRFRYFTQADILPEARERLVNLGAGIARNRIEMYKLHNKKKKMGEMTSVHVEVEKNTKGVVVDKRLVVDRGHFDRMARRFRLRRHRPYGTNRLASCNSGMNN